MRALLCCCVVLGWSALAATPAGATLLKNVRPGVMCRSADALAKLTLPDGSSRSAGSNAPLAMKAMATAGGCVDLDGSGVIVLAKDIRKNTSIVSYVDYAGGGDGPQPYYVANVDFVPFAVPKNAFNDELARHCPDKLEPIFVSDNQAVLDIMEGFEATLSPAVQKKITQVADRCEMGWRCNYVAGEEAFSKLGLDRQWADYLCQQKDFP